MTLFDLAKNVNLKLKLKHGTVAFGSRFRPDGLRQAKLIGLGSVRRSPGGRNPAPKAATSIPCFSLNFNSSFGSNTARSKVPCTFHKELSKFLY